MATQQEDAKEKKAPQPPANFGELIGDRYNKMTENAQTYPYVWASYIVVYGGFALWTTYRWSKLRKTEDRVRALQERLRQVVESEERSSSVQSTEKAPPSMDRTSK